MLTNQYAAHVIPVNSKVKVNLSQDRCWYNGITIDKGMVGVVKKVTMYIYVVEFPAYPRQEFYYEHCGGWNAGIELVVPKTRRKKGE